MSRGTTFGSICCVANSYIAVSVTRPPPKLCSTRVWIIILRTELDMSFSSKSLVALFLSALATHAIAAGPPIPKGTPIDETYRKQFANCDKHNKFETITLPLDEQLANG